MPSIAVQDTERLVTLPRLGCAIALLFLAFQAYAAGEPSPALHELIRQTARSFIFQQIKNEFPTFKIDIAPIDARLNLNTCNMPLEGYFPAGAHTWGNTTVGVKCKGDKPWAIFLPVHIQANKKVLITTRPLAEGSVLRTADLALEERDISTLTRGYIGSMEQVLGMTLKNAVADHTPLAPQMLSKPRLVSRGQQVIILAEGSGLQVRMTGTALMEGGLGDLVRVRNLGTKKIIEGRVTENGLVKLSF